MVQRIESGPPPANVVCAPLCFIATTQITRPHHATALEEPTSTRSNELPHGRQGHRETRLDEPSGPGCRHGATDQPNHPPPHGPGHSGGGPIRYVAGLEDQP